MTSLLFVYGTLKQGGQLHHELISLGARFISPVRTQGELFRIKGESWPGAFPTASQDYVHGELSRMAKPADTLKRLDEVEECERGLFVRKLVDVWAGNRKMKAWVYFFNRKKAKAARIAGGNFSTAKSFWEK